MFFEDLGMASGPFGMVTENKQVKTPCRSV